MSERVNRISLAHTIFGLKKSSQLVLTEDFSKPKIVYPETTQGAFFAFDNQGLMLDKTCFMMIADNAIYLQRTLSSRLFEFAYKNIFSSVELGTHGYQYNKHALVKLPIIMPDKDTSDELTTCSLDAIDTIVFTLYGISKSEQEALDAF